MTLYLDYMLNTETERRAYSYEKSTTYLKNLGSMHVWISKTQPK